MTKRKGSYNHSQIFNFTTFPPFTVRTELVIYPRQLTFNFPDTDVKDKLQRIRASEIVDMLRDVLKKTEFPTKTQLPRSKKSKTRDREYIFTLHDISYDREDRQLDTRAFLLVSDLQEQLYDRLRNVSTIEKQIEVIQDFHKEMLYTNIQVPEALPDIRTLNRRKKATSHVERVEGTTKKLVRERLEAFNAHVTVEGDKVDVAQLTPKVAQLCDKISRNLAARPKNADPMKLDETLEGEVMLLLANAGVKHDWLAYLSKEIADSIYEHATFKVSAAERLL